jgi:hypothetical protein
VRWRWGGGIARVRICSAIRAHPYASSAEASHFVVRHGQQRPCIQRMPFHARADPLCARLDARQVQICGSGSGPRRSLGGPMASRRPAEVAGRIKRAAACMPMWHAFVYPDAAIAGPDGRPFVSRVLSPQPSRVTARSYRRRARLRPVRRRPLQRSEHETQSRQHANDRSRCSRAKRRGFHHDCASHSLHQCDQARRHGYSPCSLAQRVGFLGPRHPLLTYQNPHPISGRDHPRITYRRFP